MWNWAQVAGVNSLLKIKSYCTATGVLDKHQAFFIEKLQSVPAQTGPAAKKQAAIDAVFKGLPTEILSPMWKIKGTTFISVTTELL
jgi:hypothetical protein